MDPVSAHALEPDAGLHRIEVDPHAPDGHGRTRIPAPATDTFLSPLIDAAHHFVVSGAVLEAAEAALAEPLE